MITVHHLNNSRSQRVLWLLEELGVPYKIQRYQRDKKTYLAPASLKAVHPLGKSPVLTDGDLTLAESGAIIEYLAETYGNNQLAISSTDTAYWQYKYWLHYAEGSLMPFLIMKMLADRIRRSKVPFFIKPITKKISSQLLSSYIAPSLQTQLAYVDQHLASHPWFAGNTLSAADFQMSFPLETAKFGTKGITEYPNLIRYVDKIQARPAYQRALEKGGDYSFAS